MDCPGDVSGIVEAMLAPSDKLHRPFRKQPDSPGQCVAKVSDFIVFPTKFLFFVFIECSAYRNRSEGVLELLEAA